MPPRVRARELWRIDPAWLEEAQDDATLVAVRDQERAGLDVITDGEMRRESYSNRFATAIRAWTSTTRARRSAAPASRRRCRASSARCTARARCRCATSQFLRAATDRPIKMTVPGPFTMAQQAQNEHYEREEDLAFAFADVVREEIAELFAAGADVVQLDEPWMEARPEAARRYGLETLQRALDGVEGTKSAAHLLRLSAVRARPPDRLPLPDRARLRARRPDLDRDRAVRTSTSRALELPARP